MNAPVTRRALLGSTLAVGAVGLPSVALACAPPAPDADAALFDLITQHGEATAAWEAACRDLEVVRDRAWAAYPLRPVALTASSADIMLHGLAPSGRSHKPGGRAGIYFTLDDFDRLRTGEPMMSMVLDENGQSLRPLPNLAGEARRREIVRSFDTWLADRAAVNDRLGLTAAETMEEPLCTIMETAEEVVTAYTPTTLAGMRVKAAWVLARCDRADAALAFLRQIVGETPSSADDEGVDDIQAAA